MKIKIFIVRACLQVGRGDEPVMKDFFQYDLLKTQSFTIGTVNRDDLSVLNSP